MFPDFFLLTSYFSRTGISFWDFLEIIFSPLYRACLSSAWLPALRSDWSSGVAGPVARTVRGIKLRRPDHARSEAADASRLTVHIAERSMPSQSTAPRPSSSSLCLYSELVSCPLHRAERSAVVLVAQSPPGSDVEAASRSHRHLFGEELVSSSASAVRL
jgi:hypothetical protein